MIITPLGYALSDAYHLEGWKPVIGYQSLVTVSNVTATSEATAYPATNLANGSTKNRWESESTGTQYLTVLFAGEEEVDYIGVARHNWGSTGATISVEAIETGDDPETDGDWSEIFVERILPDDAPVVWRLDETGFYTGIRIKIQPDGTEPTAAVLKIGTLLVLDRGLPPGHQPISYAVTVRHSAPRAVSGDFLGDIVTTASRASTIEQRDLDPTWYRENLEAFRAACESENPFFWVWSPRDYPAEVGYCWVTNSPIPSVSRTTGLIDISFQIAGIAI